MRVAKKKLLLVLDINGTLLDRIKGSEYKHARTNAHCPDSHDITINKHKSLYTYCLFIRRVFLRPYLDHFLAEIFDKYYVAAWTSAQEKNASALFKYVFGRRYSNLVFAYNRSHCQVDARGQSYKMLSKFWESPQNLQLNPSSVDRNPYSRWSRTNTILIDDSGYKALHNKENLLLLPSYSVADQDCQKDTALISIIDYLDLFTLNGMVGDVTSYLDANPLYESRRLAQHDQGVNVDERIRRDDDEDELSSWVDGSLRVSDKHYFESVCESVPKWREQIESGW